MTLDFAAMLSAVALAGGAIYSAGRLNERVERHEADTVRRLESLEEANSTRITREELDARFSALKGQLDTITTMLTKLTTTGG
ncbi:MAG: hypothetical protein K2R93_12405 [Gemmatimonadaceae bacterium]|nr:hypothetical protein [Gemmatimonadaceae bacterium]